MGGGVCVCVWGGGGGLAQGQPSTLWIKISEKLCYRPDISAQMLYDPTYTIDVSVCDRVEVPGRTIDGRNIYTLILQ